MMKEINILLSGDNNVASYLPVVVASVCVNHKKYICNFWLMHHQIDEENVKLIKTTVENFGGIFHEIIVSTNELAHSSFVDRWPVECFYYFLAYKYLPDSIDRAMYLDSDECCFGDFSDYYFADFNGNYINVAGGEGKEDKVALVVDEKTRCRASMQNDYSIFCSGSLMLNLDLFRKTFSVEEMVKAQMRRLEYIKPGDLFADQGLLNYLFYDKAGFFEQRYQATKWGMTKEKFEDIRIFHFMGYPKPWVELFEDEYMQYSPNVFGDLPYWQRIVRKWWDYAKLCPNYNELLVEAKNVFYQKIETLFKKYMSNRTVVKKSRDYYESNILIEVKNPGDCIPIADATSFETKRYESCRFIKKVRNVKYKWCLFQMYRLLEPMKRYRVVITAKASDFYQMPIYFCDESGIRTNFVGYIELTKEYKEYVLESEVKQSAEYIGFTSTNMPLDMEIYIKSLGAKEV